MRSVRAPAASPPGPGRAPPGSPPPVGNDLGPSRHRAAGPSAAARQGPGGCSAGLRGPAGSLGTACGVWCSVFPGWHVRSSVAQDLGLRVQSELPSGLARPPRTWVPAHHLHGMGPGRAGPPSRSPRRPEVRPPSSVLHPLLFRAPWAGGRAPAGTLARLHPSFGFLVGP